MISFSHGECITKYLSALQLYFDDEPLGKEIKYFRKWKSSKIDPFSSNFAAISYRFVYIIHLFIIKVIA